MPPYTCLSGQHCFHSNGACCGCGLKQTDADVMPFLHNRHPRTQKARGVKALGLTATIVQSEQDVERALSHILPYAYGSGIFARPCPKTPRPGFVESRPVSNASDLLKVWCETQAADEEGEVLLMAKIPALFNACISPGLLTVGPGNDGATAGKDARTFPILNKVPQGMRALAIKSGVPKGQEPHVEVVYSHQGDEGTMVQVRSGPPMPAGASGTRWVPEKVTVSRVISPTDDLLAWEQLCKRATPGTVAYCPGASLGSHSGLHCIANNIPFLTEEAPEVGQVLEPTPAMEAPDITEMRRGIGAAIRQPLNHGAEARASIHAILYATHHAPALTGSAAFWLGYGAMLMYRYGLSAAMGEWRHRPEKLTQRDPTTAMSREQIYMMVLRPAKQSGWLQYERHLPNIARGYFVQAWGGAFGGPNWGRCAYSLFALQTALRKVCKLTTNSSPADIKRAHLALIASLNKALHQAHNGGWWLNKFGMTQSNLSAATEGRWEPLLEVAPNLYQVQRRSEKAKERTRNLVAAIRFGRRSEVRRKPFLAVGTVAPVETTSVSVPAGQKRWKATYRIKGGKSEHVSFFNLPEKARVKAGAEVDSTEKQTKEGYDLTIKFRGVSITGISYKTEVK